MFQAVVCVVCRAFCNSVTNWCVLCAVQFVTENLIVIKMHGATIKINTNSQFFSYTRSSFEKFVHNKNADLCNIYNLILNCFSHN